MTVKRTTQVVVESLSQVDPKARATQLVVEALSQSTPKARATQFLVEVLSSNDDVPAASPTQLLIVT
jgi:hypothetical protein